MCIHDGFYNSTVSTLLRPIRRLLGRSKLAVPSRTPSLTSSASFGSDSSSASMDSIRSGSGIVDITPKTRSEICLTQHLGKGAIGEAWKGVFSLEMGSTIVLDIVAKVGWLRDACKQLLHEVEIYHQLQEHGVNGVPVLIGLFDDLDDVVPILITTYAGERIRLANESLK